MQMVKFTKILIGYVQWKDMKVEKIKGFKVKLESQENK